MSILSKKVDFVVLISVHMANANGDPLNDNRPRTDYNGYGEISDVCIKRKIRNRMQDMGKRIFVQSDDRRDDGMNSLSQRAKKTMPEKLSREDYARRACETWMDVRTFGQVFAFKAPQKAAANNADTQSEENQPKKEKEEQSGVSVGVRGPVSLHMAISVSPVEILSFQITKSVNSETNERRSSDTMGMKHMIRFGLYKLMGSINVQLAEKTGFTDEDADVVKECLRTLFVNDVSSARPDGSMEVERVYWWVHNNKEGQYSSAKVHQLVSVRQKNEEKIPDCVDDYEITLSSLPKLTAEVLDGE